jgi:SAM-dependent methyltransferase
MSDSDGRRSDARVAAQAAAFDSIGSRYDEVFPHKEGQLDGGRWLLERLPAGGRVLDVGCGTGLPTARQLSEAGLDVIGIDISPVMLDLARANVPRAQFVEADVLDVDPGLGPFDAVVAFFSLLMLTRADSPTALEHIGQLLRPGGWLVLGMVEADLDDVPIPFVGATIRVSGYPRDRLAAVTEAAGFTVDEQTELVYDPAGPGAPPEVQLFLHCRRAD